LGAIAAIGGALIQGSAAKKAAKSQEAAANRDIAFQTETRDLIRNDLGVYRSGGGLAQQALDFELGLGTRPMVGGQAPAIETYTIPGTPGATSLSSSIIRKQPMGSRATTGYRVNGQTFSTMEEAQAYANANRTGGTEYGGYTKTPGYDFRLQTGMDALQSSAAARGGLYSGAALRDSQKFGQDYGSNEYGNYLARLGARADTGMSAAQMSGSASQQAAAGVSNALGNIGNAQAAGAIGSANALTGGMQNLAGLWNYQRNMNTAAPGGGGSAGNGNFFNGLFGGGPGLGGFV
jgi:hypothetical protein